MWSLSCSWLCIKCSIHFTKLCVAMLANITKTRLFKYIESFTSKNSKISRRCTAKLGAIANDIFIGENTWKIQLLSITWQFVKDSATLGETDKKVSWNQRIRKTQNTFRNLKLKLSLRAICWRICFQNSAGNLSRYLRQTGQSIYLVILMYHFYRMHSDRQVWIKRVDTDKTQQNAVSHQGLHCCLLSASLVTARGSELYLFKFKNTYGKELRCPNT